MPLRYGVAAVLAAAVILHARTVRFGFDWDDYHFVHRYAAADVTSAFTGTWDRAGVEPPFYRPATIAWFAVRDRLIGTNPEGLHAVSLALFAGAGAAFAWWLWTLELATPAVLIGTAAFAAHPMTAPAAVWITNQMHLLQVVVVAAALGASLRAPWPWLIPLQAAALLLKEDSLVLPLAIAAGWWARRRPVPRPWILASLLLSVGYLIVRTMALHGVGGYEPDAEEMVRNLARAPIRALLVFPYNGGLWTAMGVSVLLLEAWRAARSDRRLALMAALFVLLTAPLALSSGPTRWHLLALAIAGAVAVSVHTLRETRWALPLAGAIVAGFAAASWVVANDWRPCGGEVLRHDARARLWGSAVAPELRERLAVKEASCRTE
jgi:hypothetical protein